MTGHTDEAETDLIRNNQMVRDYVNAQNKILFDSRTSNDTIRTETTIPIRTIPVPGAPTGVTPIPAIRTVCIDLKTIRSASIPTDSTAC